MQPKNDCLRYINEGGDKPWIMTIKYVNGWIYMVTVW
jgi:hypothetical protein